MTATTEATMPKSSAGAGFGLRHTLPGAPEEPHVVFSSAGHPLPGYYHPVHPTPVGEPGDVLDLDAARAVAADPAVNLELVDGIDRGFLTGYWSAVREEARTGLAQWARLATPAEKGRVADELAALSATDAPEEG